MFEDEELVTASAMEDFVHNPVWKRIKSELLGRMEACLAQGMDPRTSQEEGNLVRLEYQLIKRLLGKPKDYLDELKEDLR